MCRRLEIIVNLILLQAFLRRRSLFLTTPSREFTHRVKSVSFSKFTTEEVHALIKGGNQRAREVLLRNWDYHCMKFLDNSDANKIREFINNVYVHKIYSGESSFTVVHSTGAQNQSKDEDMDVSIGRSPTMKFSRLPGSNPEHYKRSNYVSIPSSECLNNENFAEGSSRSLNSDYPNSSSSTSALSNSLESLDKDGHTLIGKAMDEYLFPEENTECLKCMASSPKSFCTTKESFRSGSESFRSACESLDQLKKEDDLMTLTEHENYNQYHSDRTQHHTLCTITSGENLTVTLASEIEEWTKFDDTNEPTSLVSQTEEWTKFEQSPTVLPFPCTNCRQQPIVPNMEMLHCLAQSQDAVADSKDLQNPSSMFQQQYSQEYIAWRRGNPFAD